MPEQYSILGGKVHVYKRPNSSLWQCSSYFAGKNRRTSTKEESLSKAKEIAEDWYLLLRGKSRAGILNSEETFARAAKAFVTSYGILTEGQRSEKWTEGHEIRLRVHLIPFFGEMGLISGRRRSATVVAAADCVLFETPRRTMLKLIQSVDSVRRTLDQAAIMRQVQTHLAPGVPADHLKDLVGAAEIQRWRAGDTTAVSRRLYTAAGQQTFDELRRPALRRVGNRQGWPPAANARRRDRHGFCLGHHGFVIRRREATLETLVVLLLNRRTLRVRRGGRHGMPSADLGSGSTGRW